MSRCLSLSLNLIMFAGKKITYTTPDSGHSHHAKQRNEQNKAVAAMPGGDTQAQLLMTDCRDSHESIVIGSLRNVCVHYDAQLHETATKRRMCVSVSYT